MFRNILVWGGTGFIGRHLVDYLASIDDSVCVLTRGAANRGSSATYIKGVPSAWPPSQLRDLVGRFSVIYNLAASAGAVTSNQSASESLQSNLAETLLLLEACAHSAHRPRVVFASSRLVYGSPTQLPVTESHKTSPQSIYGAHKLCAEHYHQIFALKGAITHQILRISNPFGYDCDCERKSYGFINLLMQQAARGRPLKIFGGGEQLRDYIHIDDLTQALWLAGKPDIVPNQILNIGAGTSISIGEAARIIGDRTGAPVVFTPWDEAYAAVESGDYSVDIGRARGVLGYRPQYGFRNGVPDIISKYREADRIRTLPELVGPASPELTSAAPEEI